MLHLHDNALVYTDKPLGFTLKRGTGPNAKALALHVVTSWLTKAGVVCKYVRLYHGAVDCNQ